MLIDLHIHGMAHGEYSHSREELLPFIQNAKGAGISIIGFAEHDWYLEDINHALLKNLGEENEMDILVGVEVDHGGNALQKAEELSKYDFDYLIGSIHEVNGWPFDHPDHRDGFSKWDIDSLYSEYFSLMENLISCGIYDIVGHMDLIKIYGHRPNKNIDDYVRPLLKTAAEKDMVVEVNTSGVYKPVGEIYPGRRILEICKQLGVPITLGSDAHLPGHVEGYCNDFRNISGDGF